MNAYMYVICKVPSFCGTMNIIYASVYNVICCIYSRAYSKLACTTQVSNTEFLPPVLSLKETSLFRLLTVFLLKYQLDLTKKRKKQIWGN